MVVIAGFTDIYKQVHRVIIDSHSSFICMISLLGSRKEAVCFNFGPSYSAFAGFTAQTKIGFE